MSNNSVDALLSERGRTHGDFAVHARVTTRLKDVIMDEIADSIRRGQQPLTLVQRESLDMICHKIGRTIAGDPGFQDHWDDIAGYARLVSQRCAATASTAPITVTWGDDPGDSQGGASGISATE